MVPPNKYVKSRDIQGNIKTVSVTRDAAHRLWLCFSVVEHMYIPKEASSGKTGGFDFGLKTFLTDHEGYGYMNPEFLMRALSHIQKLSRKVSRKVNSSRNKAVASKLLARTQIHVADKRRDYHFQLAHELCDHFDILCFEDLNIQGMKSLWGRKVSDLGFVQFMDILAWVAFKPGKKIVKIGRWEPTTKACSTCGTKQAMPLTIRTYEYQHCDLVLDRDHNAALTIQQAGHHLLLDEVSRLLMPESPEFVRGEYVNYP